MRREPEHVSTTVTLEHVRKTAKTPLGQALLRREAAVLHKASGRAGAPRLLSSHLESEPFSILLQKIAGESLQQAIVARKRASPSLPAALALQWLLGATKAVELWHSQTRMVHGDIAPGNILLHGPQAFLIDFALATPFGKPVRLGDKTLANRAYASPEQLAGETVGPQSDVFSLAVIATELLTGKRFDRLAPTSGYAALPDEVAKVLLEGVASNPSQRTSRPGLFAQALELAACG